MKVKMQLRFFLISAALVMSVFSTWGTAQADDTLRVVTHNSLNFRDSRDTDRLQYFRIEMESIEPDIAVMQEIWTQDAVDLLLSFVYLPVNDDWATAAFVDGRDTDNMLFYRTSKVALVSQREIQTELRDISEYVLRPAVGDTTIRFRIYSAHLKASEGATNEERRRQECVTLRQQLDLLPMGSQFMMVGDFNLYTSAEPAYQVLLAETPELNGQLFDPINRPGNWHNAVNFADIHTQSTRTTDFGGGSTGGLDDRFDFILVSAAFMDTAGSYVMPSTYHAYGNDGQHFNQDINDGTNGDVPDSVADALYYASDHLPVVANFVIRSEPSDVTERPTLPKNPDLFACYPNPFNGSLKIEIQPFVGSGNLMITDVLGRRVLEKILPSSPTRSSMLWLNFNGHSSGIYLVKIKTRQAQSAQRVLYLR